MINRKGFREAGSNRGGKKIRDQKIREKKVRTTENRGFDFVLILPIKKKLTLNR